jgi:hypothetical protein
VVDGDVTFDFEGSDEPFGAQEFTGVTHTYLREIAEWIRDYNRYADGTLDPVQPEEIE